VAVGSIASSFSGRFLLHGVKWRVSCSQIINFITVTLLCNVTDRPNLPKTLTMDCVSFSNSITLEFKTTVCDCT